MITTIQCRLATETELGEAAVLAQEVFDEFVAPFYSQEGREEFHRYAETTALRDRNRLDHVTLIAQSGEQIIGMLHLRQWRHVAMLFVDRPHQRDGIGRKLLGVAIELGLGRDGSARRLTVNSSPNAVEAYRRLGFSPVGPEQIVHGIRFVPMALEFTQSRGGEPSASPNGGPAEPLGNSGAGGGLPSVIVKAACQPKNVAKHRL